ncbi:alpha/beta hydrolase [Alphaproteobacteria bacterium 46_93_T64]|nr:alpha/beta hydrolase [Alphaproteobacteria bacterium 46_93_T64]
MEWCSGEYVSFCVDGVQLEGKCLGPSPADTDTIVLLHEGLGSVELWRDFPEKLAAETGFGVFVYSRQGYGRSDPIKLPRPLSYMNVEGEQVLPMVLDEIGLKSGFLLGHSDGGSIAAIYAACHQDDRLKAISLIAPHFFSEPISTAAIRKVSDKYERSDLRQKLSKYHADVDGAFRGWCDSWLDPEFAHWNIEDFISNIRVPVLAVQGREDEYGTLKQMETLQVEINSPLQIEVFDKCGHSPHLEYPDRLIPLLSCFFKNYA